MGALVKLDQKRRKHVIPTRIRVTTKGNFVPLIGNVTNPQIVLPRLDINILRGVHISDEAEMGIASVQESDGDAAYRPVRLLLAQLMREETATAAEGDAAATAAEPEVLKEKKKEEGEAAGAAGKKADAPAAKKEDKK